MRRSARLPTAQWHYQLTPNQSLSRSNHAAWRDCLLPVAAPAGADRVRGFSWAGLCGFHRAQHRGLSRSRAPDHRDHRAAARSIARGDGTLRHDDIVTGIVLMQKFERTMDVVKRVREAGAGKELRRP